MEKKVSFNNNLKFMEGGEECSNLDCNENIIKLNMSNRAVFIVLVKNNTVDHNITDIYTILKNAKH